MFNFGIILPDYKAYYKDIVIKTVWYWHKNRTIDQWNKFESPRFSTKSQKQYSEVNLFNKWLFNNWTIICKKKTPHFDHSLYHIKIISELILDLTVKPNTVKQNLYKVIQRFPRYNTKTSSHKKIDILDCIQIKPLKEISSKLRTS